MHALATCCSTEVDLRIQRTLRRGHRLRRLADRRVGGDQFQVAVDGTAHHLIELGRAKGGPPLPADFVAQGNTLRTALAKTLFGLLIVML
ncbi:hypothetical protein D3C73_1500260 [compost metagenome]